jgi:hypothetical protein
MEVKKGKRILGKYLYKRRQHTGLGQLRDTKDNFPLRYLIYSIDMKHILL